MDLCLIIASVWNQIGQYFTPRLVFMCTDHKPFFFLGRDYNLATNEHIFLYLFLEHEPNTFRLRNRGKFYFLVNGGSRNIKINIHMGTWHIRYHLVALYKEYYCFYRTPLWNHCYIWKCSYSWISDVRCQKKDRRYSKMRPNFATTGLMSSAAAKFSRRTGSAVYVPYLHSKDVVFLYYIIEGKEENRRLFSGREADTYFKRHDCVVIPTSVRVLPRMVTVITNGSLQSAFSMTHKIMFMAEFMRSGTGMKIYWVGVIHPSWTLTSPVLLATRLK